MKVGFSHWFRSRVDAEQIVDVHFETGSTVQPLALEWLTGFDCKSAECLAVLAGMTRSALSSASYAYCRSKADGEVGMGTSDELNCAVSVGPNRWLS